MRLAVVNPKFLRLDDVSIWGYKLHIEHTAYVCGHAVVRTYHVCLVPDAFSFEISGVVEMKIDLFLGSVHVEQHGMLDICNDIGCRPDFAVRVLAINCLQYT